MNCCFFLVVITKYRGWKCFKRETTNTYPSAHILNFNCLDRVISVQARTVTVSCVRSNEKNTESKFLME